MKIDTNIFKVPRWFSKKAAVMLLFFSTFYGLTSMAQNNGRGDRNGNFRGDRSSGNSRGQSEVRQDTRESDIRREPSIRGNNDTRSMDTRRTQTDRTTAFNNDRNNINRNPANQGNFDRNVRQQPDRGTRQYNDLTNNGIVRNNSDRSGNINYNRPGNAFNRPDYNNRGGYDNYGNRGNRYQGYNNNRRSVYNAYNPSWRYGYLPRRNSVFNVLPSFYFNLNFGGYGYRYYDGVFYRPYNNTFRVIAPPIGIYLNTLPIGYRTIYVHDYPYYYYNGTYYDHRDDDNYIVVSPPVGAIVESIPGGYEEVTIDGETYYTVDGAQYKPVVQENGEIWYEVIKAN